MIEGLKLKNNEHWLKNSERYLPYLNLIKGDETYFVDSHYISYLAYLHAAHSHLEQEKHFI